MNNDLISRNALKEQFNGVPDSEDKDIALMIIDNAPTVDTACPHCDSGYAQGYSDGYLRGKEERPQGDFAEKLKDRIEESICKRCQMDENVDFSEICVLCKISRVFQIITLTAEETKGGAE